MAGRATALSLTPLRRCDWRWRDARQKWPGQTLLATGYCWGGGVGVQMTYGPNPIDVVVVAHAAQVSLAQFQNVTSPLLAVMPQNDPGL